MIEKIKERIKEYQIEVEEYQKQVDDFRLNTDDPEHHAIGLGLLLINTSKKSITDLELILELVAQIPGLGQIVPLKQ